MLKTTALKIAQNGLSLLVIVFVILKPSLTLADLFAPYVRYGAGWPASITSGDFNGDGKMDMATSGGNGVSILIGNGDGTLQKNVDYPIGSSLSIFAKDFNNDGKADIVTGIGVLLGNGDGTFQLYTNSLPSRISSFFTVDDFNSDGKTDIATLSSILFGTGDGSFSDSGIALDLGYSYNIITADFNNDGNADLAATDRFASTLLILIGNGDGTFQKITAASGIYGKRFLASGDLNDDGKMDLVTANGLGDAEWTPFSISVFIGNGDGTFSSIHDYSAGWMPTSVYIEDFNGDGNADVAVGTRIWYWGGDSVFVFTGNGDGTLNRWSNYRTYVYPSIVYACDLNGDGHPELAATTQGEISLLLNLTDTTPPMGSILINGDALYATSPDVTLTLSATDNLSGISKMRFSNDSINWSTWESYISDKSWTLLSGDGLKTIYVQYMDAAGNTSISYSDIIVIDTAAPAGSIIINSDAASTSSSLVTLTLNVLDSSIVTYMRFSNDNNSMWSDWEPFSTIKIWKLTENEGTKTVDVQFKDTAGHLSSRYSDAITLTYLRAGSISINGGFDYTTYPSVSLSISAPDAIQMRLSNDTLTWSAWEAYSISKGWSFTSGDGPKTVYIQFKDSAGNISIAYDDIVLDTTPPSSIFVKIVSSTEHPLTELKDESGDIIATYTNSPIVTLAVSASDGSGSGVARVIFSNNNATWGNHTDYTNPGEWDLNYYSSGDGTKKVYAQFMDNANYARVLAGVIYPSPIWSNIIVSNSVILDTTPPTGSISINGGATYTSALSVNLTTSASDSLSGISEMRFSDDNIYWSSWETYTTNKAWTLSTGDGTKIVYVQYMDIAGNIATYSGEIILDSTPPAGSVMINNDVVFTNSTSAILTSSATDNLSGISQMRFSNDNTNWFAWEPYNTSKNWTLSNTSDLMTVYVQFMDIAGNMSASYSDTIYIDTDDDGIYDSVDNCPNVNNPLQEDRNGNGIGDACDGDLDGDTIVDIRDNCLATSNLDQLDSDGDGVGDVCDACISDPQNNCLNSSSFISTDITQPVTVSNFADTASVTIEPGDISTDTSITVTGETSTSNFAWGSNQQVLGAIYTFTADPPSDINSPFNSTVRITLKYDQGTMPEGGMTEQNLNIYYYDINTLTWVSQQNVLQDMVNNTLSLDISHFSSYAVIATENPISDLIAAFKEVKIENSGTWASLFEKISYAYDYYEQGDLGKTKETLNAFINELKALSGKKVNSVSADMLIQFANENMARL